MTPAIDFTRARENMINQQLRTWEVLDERVLERIAGTPRDEFVPEQFRSLAYADHSLPLGYGQVMMVPKIEARLLQALNIQPTDTILEIGTGSGYLTALLARSGRHVVSVDIFPEFTESAAEKLSAHGIHNVMLETGDAAGGWPEYAPYDVVVVTGSLPVPDEQFQYCLANGGRLFIIVGEAPVMEAMLITRVGDNEWTHESLFETVVPPLVNAPLPPRFEL